jgi:cysteine synthase
MHAIEGVKHLPTTGHIPEIYDERRVDRFVDTSTNEAYCMLRRLAQDEGLLVGVSAAAAAVAAIKVAEELEQGLVVTVFPDGADRYLSLPVMEEL